MNVLQELDRIDPADVASYGGKACHLARLMHARLPVPGGFVLPASIYRKFVDETGLSDAIHFELGRKAFEQMRWEELWDIALRLRGRFLKAEFPSDLEACLKGELDEVFGSEQIAVRSSAPSEDGLSQSFAGLHDSILGVQGREDVLLAIRRVWASLWSDRALLYRQELNLDPATSAMAVVLMKLEPSRSAGVLFGRSPTAFGQGVIEAVHGQGQGLVEGSVAPDRWLIDRKNARILEHQPPEKRQQSHLQKGRIEPGAALEDYPPLQPEQVLGLWQIGCQVEALYGAPMDCEWCLVQEDLLLLQARPLTHPSIDPEDKRPWYLSLHPSRATLEKLGQAIEEERLPAMDREADRLTEVDLAGLSVTELADAIEQRREAVKRWNEIYQREYIPMAHGIRLFGEVYNDRLNPDDPFAFVRLLAGGELRALKRNRAMETLAAAVRTDAALRKFLQEHAEPPPGSSLKKAWQEFLDEHGDPAWFAGAGALADLVLALAAVPAKKLPEGRDTTELEQRFFKSFPEDQQTEAAELLGLGRAAYRLRDNDNIFFGRFLAELKRACSVATGRLASPTLPQTERKILEKVLDEEDRPGLRGTPAPSQGKGQLQARQLIGQPAGPGTARGPARVIRHPADLNAFRAGEILVCDAVDPTMTFVAPLAAAVVERRGGMLIHGAIIAREYGLPCVTGVPALTELVQDGQQLTVDGWLGLIILENDEETS